MKNNKCPAFPFFTIKRNGTFFRKSNSLGELDEKLASSELKYINKTDDSAIEVKFYDFSNLEKACPTLNLKTRFGRNNTLQFAYRDRRPKIWCNRRWQQYPRPTSNPVTFGNVERITNVIPRKFRNCLRQLYQGKTLKCVIERVT